MCTVWAALFLFLSFFRFGPAFSTSLKPPPVVLPLHTSSSSLSASSSPPLLSSTPALRLSAASLFFLPRRPPTPLTRCLSPSRFLSRAPTLRHSLPFPLAHRVSFLSLSLRLSRALDFSPASFTVPRSLLSLVSIRRPLSTHHPRAAAPRPPLSHTPAAAVETARFFPPVSSAPTFFTPFFSPPPSMAAAHAPLPRRREHRLEHPRRLPLSHIRRTYARDPSSSLSFALFATPGHPFSPPFRPPRLPPPFHFSLPFAPPSTPHPPRPLAPVSPTPPSAGSYLFDFFFATTRPPTDAARRRPFSIGTLFSTIGSATYSRTPVRPRDWRSRARGRGKGRKRKDASETGR